jgi:hypothetical protein
MQSGDYDSAANPKSSITQKWTDTAVEFIATLAYWNLWFP